MQFKTTLSPMEKDGFNPQCEVPRIDIYNSTDFKIEVSIKVDKLNRVYITLRSKDRKSTVPLGDDPIRM